MGLVVGLPLVGAGRLEGDCLMGWKLCWDGVSITVGTAVGNGEGVMDDGRTVGDENDGGNEGI